MKATKCLYVAALPLVLMALGSSQAPANGRRPAPEVRQTSFSGTSCLALEDVARAINGHLRWHPVAGRVDLSFLSHDVQFFVGSNRAVVDGHPEPLEIAPVKNERDVWVPTSFFQNGSLARYFRRSIELQTHPSSASASTPAAPPTPIAKPPTAQSAPITPSAAKTLPPTLAQHAVKRIVIDPGHGGKDPGTVGANGTEEKAINLWMAQELADALREKDYEVLLTRTDDSFIPLSERAALANKYRADLFMSLHCNASLSSSLNGFEVYFLSEKSSDPHADAVARMENASLALEGKTPPYPVQLVLRSLVKNAHINKSSQLGALIDRSVSIRLSQSHLGVKQAGFYVLRDAEMPAILIEIGFLSNAREERRLRDPAYRGRLVRAIEEGVIEYDRRNATRTQT